MTEDKEANIHVDTLTWWSLEQQLPSGGLNRRPEKLEDVSLFFSPPSQVLACTIMAVDFYTPDVCHSVS